MGIYSTENTVNIIRFIIGFILVIISLRAFLKLRIPAMLYLTTGFALMTIGNLFSAIYYFDNLHMDNVVSDIFDILGFVALIIAIKKS